MIAKLASHQAIARHDMANLEGLVLTHVAPGHYTLIALPLRLAGADASPVRAALLQGRQMTLRRANRVRLLLRIALVLTCVQYAVATVGAQLFEMPVRTDFASYYLAGQLTAQNANPYDATALAEAGHAIGFDFDQYPFLYPPVFALAVQPLSQVSFPTARQIWMLLSTLCLAVALIVTARSVRLLARQLEIQQKLFAWLVLVPFVIMVLHSTAVHNDVRSGSVGSMLWMCLILVLYNTQQPPGLQLLVFGWQWPPASSWCRSHCCPG